MEVTSSCLICLQSFQKSFNLNINGCLIVNVCINFFYLLDLPLLQNSTNSVFEIVSFILMWIFSNKTFQAFPKPKFSKRSIWWIGSFLSNRKTATSLWMEKEALCQFRKVDFCKNKILVCDTSNIFYFL